MQQASPMTSISHAMADLHMLSRKDLTTDRFRLWRQFTVQALIEVVGADSPVLDEFESICFQALTGAPPEEAESVWRSGKTCALALLTTVRFQSYLEEGR